MVSHMAVNLPSVTTTRSGQAKPLVRGVVLLMLPGLSRSVFAKRGELLPNVAALLGKPAVVLTPNATVHPGMCECQLPILQFSVRGGYEHYGCVARVWRHDVSDKVA